MSLLKCLSALDKQLAERQKKIFSKYLNLHTYGGAFRSLLMYLVAWYLLRNIDDMSTWVENFLNLEYDQPTEADKSWHRLWANILGGGGVLLSVYAMIMLTLKRFQERNGQSDTKAPTSNMHAGNNKE